MNFNEYQELAGRTAGNHFSSEQAYCNWAMGLCGEAGEYSELIKKHVFHGKELDQNAAVKELGDCLWYLAMCASKLGVQLEEIATLNIDKLRARYPVKFELGGGIRNEGA
jgi:NTP pyrophosphatase (non-canonical NTP hydrolase)